MKKLSTICKSLQLSMGTLAYLLIGTASFAQDIHFSQYTQTSSLVNPALTGTAAVLRATVIYKDQWRSVTVPYKTYGASVEMKFKASNWQKVDAHATKTYKKAFSRMAGGLSFFSDKAGDGNMGTSQVNLSLASFVPINDNSSLSLGLQGSLVQRKIDFSKLIFPDQYNGIAYDPNVYNGENVASQNFIYPDFAGGVNWSYGNNEKAIGANDELKVNVGVSVYHINKPKQKFLTASDEKLNAKIVLHGDLLFGITGTNLAFAPSYLLEFQKPAKEILVGTLVKYYLKDNSKYTGLIKKSAFGLGVYYRNKDAVILSGLIEFGQYAIGCSYDLNTSKLSPVSKVRGGAEIFIRFQTASPFLYQKK